MTTGEPQTTPTEEKTANVNQPPQGSQVFSVRLAAGSVPAFFHLIRIHFRLQHIPQPTESAYLQYLITQDAEKMRDDIINRRKAIAR